MIIRLQLGPYNERTVGPCLKILGHTSIIIITMKTSQRGEKLHPSDRWEAWWVDDLSAGFPLPKDPRSSRDGNEKLLSCNQAAIVGLFSWLQLLPENFDVLLLRPLSRFQPLSRCQWCWMCCWERGGGGPAEETASLICPPPPSPDRACLCICSTGMTRHSFVKSSSWWGCDWEVV